MSAMEPSTTSRPSASEPARTDATNTFKTANAPADRHFKQTTLPSLGGTGPILPESVRKFFRKRFRHTDTPASR